MKIEIGAGALTPNMLWAQFAPAVASQTRSQSSAIANSTISPSAKPADFNSTQRNGGENIWTSALTAASIIICILLPAVRCPVTTTLEPGVP